MPSDDRTAEKQLFATETRLALEKTLEMNPNAYTVQASATGGIAGHSRSAALSAPRLGGDSLKSRKAFLWLAPRISPKQVDEWRSADLSLLVFPSHSAPVSHASAARAPTAQMYREI